MTNPAQIVCFGSDAALLQSRRAVLATQYRVTPVADIASLRQLSPLCPFEIFVLCHTLSVTDYHDAVEYIHSCCPAAGVVALTKIGQERELRGSDHTLGSLAGPEALIAMVRTTLQEQHRLAELPRAASQLRG